MAGERNEQRVVSATRRALALVTQAMDLLDAHGGPPDAAAHLAMAQQQLRQALVKDGI
jgi:hypothetical protein